MSPQVKGFYESIPCTRVPVTKSPNSNIWALDKQGVSERLRSFEDVFSHLGRVQGLRKFGYFILVFGDPGQSLGSLKMVKMHTTCSCIYLLFHTIQITKLIY